MNNYEDIHTLLDACSKAARASRTSPERMMFRRVGRDEDGQMIEMSGVVERVRGVTPLTPAVLPRRAPKRKGAKKKHGCGCKACEEKVRKRTS